MCFSGIMVAICICFEFVESYCPLSDYERLQVPPLFASDSFPECKNEGNRYCRLKFTLRSENNDTESWRVTEKSRIYKECFSRDVVYRFRCLPKILEDEREIQLNAIQNENRLLTNFSMKAGLDTLKCNKYHSRMDYLTTYDYILMLVLMGYLVTVGTATVIDLLKSKEGKIERGPDFLTNFSILSQWKSLKKPINDPEYNKMKCLQGVRTYTMALVVSSHTISSRAFSYVKDEKFVENLYVETTYKMLVNLGFLLVQTNFLMSGWLATKMVFNHVDKGGQVSIKFVFKRMFMRYVRLFFPLAFVISLERSNWARVLFDPPPLESFDMDYDGCQKNWWASLLLLSNMFLSSEMCNLGLWYLTIDFQMYIISLVIYYLMFKFRIGMKMIAWVMAVFWLVTACLIYYHNFAVMYPYYADYLPLWYSMSSYQLYVLYNSLYINFGSYGVGLLFGYLNHRYKNHTFHFNKVVLGLWLLLFLGLPVLVIYSSLFEYARLTSALLGPSLKLLFSLGIAVGLLGMIHGLGGIIKTICEWEFAEFVARWSYSTYVIHFFVVFGRHLLEDPVEDISHEILIKSAVLDVIQSFIAGLVVHLIIERPMASICSRFLFDKLNKTEEAKKLNRKKN